MFSLLEFLKPKNDQVSKHSVLCAKAMWMVVSFIVCHSLCVLVETSLTDLVEKRMIQLWTIRSNLVLSNHPLTTL